MLQDFPVTTDRVLIGCYDRLRWTGPTVRFRPQKSAPVVGPKSVWWSPDNGVGQIVNECVCSGDSDRGRVVPIPEDWRSSHRAYPRRDLSLPRSPCRVTPEPTCNAIVHYDWVGKLVLLSFAKFI